MDSTGDNPNADSTPQSLEAAWRHCRDVFLASSVGEAWSSFKQMMETLPVWALVVAIVGLLALAANAWILVVPLAAGCMLAAIYFTVKHAVRVALREHDSDRRP